MAVGKRLDTMDQLPHNRLRRYLVRKFNKMLESQGELSKKRKWQAIKKALPFLESTHRQHKWIQLAGHQDSFAVGEEGTILKKLQTNERDVLERLMADRLKSYVPEYRGIVTIDDTCYIEMQDLLQGFTNPCVMDCKMGTRTYLEEELTKLEKDPQPRKDMYEKMIKVDPLEPTAEEHASQAVTKPRYMQWREKISSSHTLGFRIEGVKNSEGQAFVEFKNCKDRKTVSYFLEQFTCMSTDIIRQYLQRLRALRSEFQDSAFFRTHEIIGSSLLFVHDSTKAGVWMIDFGKTIRMPEGRELDHTTAWSRGNHEDGYLTGVNSMIELFEGILCKNV